MNMKCQIRENVPEVGVEECMLSHSVVSDSAILWNVAHQAPLSVGFSRQAYWSGVPFSSPGDLPYPGIEPASPVSPALKVDSLPAEPPGKPRLNHLSSVQFSSVQSLSHVRLFATP